MLFSGELSMTTSELAPPPEEGLDVVPPAGLDPLDEQAARPAARRPAAVSASAALPVTLLIINFDLPLGCRGNED
jgi:hypothetical protein